jgi:hypothetical protein
MTTHPTSEQIERYRNRMAAPDELISVDQHIAQCDRCYATLGGDNAHEIVLSIADDTEHLTYDQMEQWLDGRVQGVERELIEGHKDLCDLCRNELADLARSRDSMRGVVPQRTLMRMLLPIAAIVAIAVVGALLFLQNQRVVVPRPRPVSKPYIAPTLPEPLRVHIDEVLRTGILAKPDVVASLSVDSSALRGTAHRRATFSLQQPIATVVLDPRPQFVWEPTAGADSYTVTVVDAESGAVAGTGVTGTASWRPAEPLKRGRTYSWEVKAHRGNRVITAPRPPAPEARFRVAALEQIDAIAMLPAEAHLARGIVLAEQGILDDAERELTLAERAGGPKAAGLLARVRSWRSLQWPSPTTTNAAQ